MFAAGNMSGVGHFFETSETFLDDGHVILVPIGHFFEKFLVDGHIIGYLFQSDTFFEKFLVDGHIILVPIGHFF
jgi:hypothetical protein